MIELLKILRNVVQDNISSNPSYQNECMKYLKELESELTQIISESNENRRQELIERYAKSLDFFIKSLDTWIEE